MDLTRKAAKALFEDVGEVRGTPEAASIRDLFDRKLRIRFQQMQGLNESNLKQVLMNAFPLVMLKESVQVTPAHPNRFGDVIHLQRTPVILAHERDGFVAHALTCPLTQLHLRRPAPDSVGVQTTPKQQPVPHPQQASEHAFAPGHRTSCQLTSLHGDRQSLRMMGRDEAHLIEP